MKRKIIFWTICFALGVILGVVAYRRGITSEDIGEVSGVEQVSVVVQMRIDDGGNGVMVFDNLEIRQVVTALDLLKRIALEEGFNLSIKQSAYGEYISGIGGKEADESHFWSFLINGEVSPVGAGSYQLLDGDTIEYCWTEF